MDGDVGHDCLLAQYPHEIRSRIASATKAGLCFLLAALAVQLVLNGLYDVGVIHLTSH